MRKIVFIGILAIIKTVSFAQTVPIIYSDSGTSSIEILSKNTKDEDGNEIIEYLITNVHYDTEGIDLSEIPSELKHYISKYITTSLHNTFMGVKYLSRNIKIELFAFDNPHEIVLSIDKTCDKIELDFRKYTTITYGCCDMPDYYELFDYKHKPIIQAHNEIIIGYIPQSHIEIYIGYKHELKDASFFGTLYISYNSDEKYEIRVKSKEIIPTNCLKIDILPENDNSKHQNISKRFKYFQNEIIYDIWSLKGIKDKRQINGLKILLEYNCDVERNPSIEIPIINGKPFGNDMKIQEIEINF